MRSRGASEWPWGVIMVVLEGRPGGPGGHLSGPGGVILVVHEGRPWGPRGASEWPLGGHPGGT